MVYTKMTDRVIKSKRRASRLLSDAVKWAKAKITAPHC